MRAEAQPGPAAKSPLSQAELPTTDGALALGNLDAHIAGGEASLVGDPRLDRMASLIADLQTRAEFQGRLADYERAAELTARVVQRFPGERLAYALRAKANAIYHRFPDALSDLDRAQQLGVPAAAQRSERAAILQATGHYAEALAVRHALAEEKRDLSSMASEASVLSDMGETLQADALFAEAQQHYRDVAPFAVAWLWFQQGSMWEKAGKPTRARALFEAAVERVPGYAHAVSHLASLSSVDRARSLLEAVVRTSDDPEYAAQLGVLLRESEQSERGDELVRAAGAAYVKLTDAHPEAFADHAARFWLGAGANAGKARGFAQLNFAARPTLDALTLLVDAEVAAPDAQPNCAAAEQALALAKSRPAVHLLAARALDACGRPDDATRERALASLRK